MGPMGPHGLPPAGLGPHPCQSLIMYHKGAVEGYPLQTYASALLFSPTGSLIRQLFEHEEPEAISIRPALSDGWSSCLQTLEGHSSYVYSVAFSHDLTRLASASRDSTVKIWDASSGACLQTLEGYGSMVSSADLVSLLASLHSNKTVIDPQQPVSYGIGSNRAWISNNAQDMFWLPTEYRPACSAVLGRCVGIGTGSGKVWFCCFL
jgi:WD40 repeat protein